MMLEQESLIDLTISNSSVIALGAGDGPLGTLQVDPKIQERKEMRLKEIQEWLADERDASRKLNKDMTDKDFDTDVILAKQDRCLRKLEMLTEMFTVTAQTEGKLYGDNPAIEWVLEFRLKWEKCGGTELDKKVNEEYTKQAMRLKQAIDSEYLWRDATVVEDPQRTTPPPNSPPSM